MLPIVGLAIINGRGDLFPAHLVGVGSRLADSSRRISMIPHDDTHGRCYTACQGMLAFDLGCEPVEGFSLIPNGCLQDRALDSLKSPLKNLSHSSANLPSWEVAAVALANSFLYPWSHVRIGNGIWSALKGSVKEYPKRGKTTSSPATITKPFP